MTCVICGLDIDVQFNGWTEGHNAQPLKDGRCCTPCNSTVVLPARLKPMMGLQPGTDGPELEQE